MLLQTLCNVLFKYTLNTIGYSVASKDVQLISESWTSWEHLIYDVRELTNTLNREGTPTNIRTHRPSIPDLSLEGSWKAYRASSHWPHRKCRPQLPPVLGND